MTGQDSRALRRTAARLATLLGPEECLLVGGLAVAAHGYVRATDDVDFVTRRSLSEARELLRRGGISTTQKKGDPLEGDCSCLKGILDGVHFDILPELVPLAWERATELRLSGVRVRVVDLEGLLRLKFRAGGPQDLMDVAFLLLSHPALLQAAREVAKAYGLAGRLESWLLDPRVRSQAEEELKRTGEKTTLAELSRLLPKPKRRAGPERS